MLLKNNLNIENVKSISDIDLEEVDENENIIEMWEPLEFDIDENYEFVPKSKIFTFLSNIVYYVIGYPVLKILMKIIYDLKIEGKENIRNIDENVVSVSNHVLFLDCAIIRTSIWF